jgi:hypothetical protein
MRRTVEVFLLWAVGILVLLGTLTYSLVTFVDAFAKADDYPGAELLLIAGAGLCVFVLFFGLAFIADRLNVLASMPIASPRTAPVEPATPLN